MTFPAPFTPPVLRTERLVLRPATLADAPAMFANWSSHLDGTRYLPWPTHAAVADAEAWLAKNLGDPGRPTALWVMAEHEEGDAFGIVLLRLATPQMELGYGLGSRWWGKGYAGEGGAAAMAWAFTQPGVERVGAVLDAENAGSVRVCEKLGMTYAERFTDDIPHPNIDATTPRPCLRYVAVRAPSRITGAAG